jgi:hypothetical protein
LILALEKQTQKRNRENNQQMGENGNEMACRIEEETCAQGCIFIWYYYLTLERARLAIIILRARIVAMQAFPTCRAGATAVHRVAFRSIETRTAIAAIRAPFVLWTSCWQYKNTNVYLFL